MIFSATKILIFVQSNSRSNYYENYSSKNHIAVQKHPTKSNQIEEKYNQIDMDQSRYKLNITRSQENQFGGKLKITQTLI